MKQKQLWYFASLILTGIIFRWVHLSKIFIIFITSLVTFRTAEKLTEYNWTNRYIDSCIQKWPSSNDLTLTRLILRHTFEREKKIKSEVISIKIYKHEISAISIEKNSGFEPTTAGLPDSLTWRLDWLCSRWLRWYRWYTRWRDNRWCRLV